MSFISECNKKKPFKKDLAGESNMKDLIEMVILQPLISIPSLITVRNSLING